MDIATIITLVQAGVTTFQKIHAAHEAGKLTLTDDQLNQILDAMAADDDRLAAESEKIARGE